MVEDPEITVHSPPLLDQDRTLPNFEKFNLISCNKCI